MASRYRGPTGSGNGGYISGLLAGCVGVTHADETAPHGVERRAVAVALRSPVPLDTPLTATVTAGRAVLHGDVGLLAEAGHAELDADPLEPVPYADALAAGERYPGNARHPMPHCFGCGVRREAGDGLRLAIGPVGDGRVAAAWVPDASLARPGAATGEGPVGQEFVWTALDCTSAWTWDFAAEPALLGTMTGIVDDAPYVHDRCVAVGGIVGREGRKIRTASTLYDEDGRVLGRAQSVWITVDPSRL